MLLPDDGSSCPQVVLSNPAEQFEAKQLEAVAGALDRAGLLETLGSVLEACQMPVPAIDAFQRWGGMGPDSGPLPAACVLVSHQHDCCVAQ